MVNSERGGAELVVRVVPWRIRNWLRGLRQTWTMRRAVPQFLKDPLRALRPGDSLLEQLIFGWGNTSYSAQTEYLVCCLEAILKCDGPVLECGSGLSTFVLGVVAQQRNVEIWSLESAPPWSARVRALLAQHRIRSAVVCDAPLRDYGGYSWYSPPLSTMPDDFGLVICDGPPGETPGGRYGLLPVMHSRLRPGCRILLDDADREEERLIASRWQAEFGGRFAVNGERKRFIAYDLAGNAPGAAAPA